MVSKTVCFSLVVFAVLVMTTAAKPFSEDNRESNAYYAEDSVVADGPPPRIRINRHGKRGLFHNLEERDFEGETEYVLNGARGMDLADSPQRLRMNRHGK